MAITITGVPSDSKMLAGFNVNTIGISSSVTGASRAELFIQNASVGTPYRIDLTNDSNGDFSFNFEGVYRDLCNEAEFNYSPQFSYPDISTPANSFFIDSGACTTFEFWIDIYDVNNVLIDSLASSSKVSLFFVKASMQLLESTVMDAYSHVVGSSSGYHLPLTPSDTIPLWQGYPIEFAFDSYNDANQFLFINGSGTSVTGINSGTNVDRIVRFCIIDENEVEISGITNNLANDISILLNNGEYINTFINYRTPTGGCPKYFRWKNQQGGTSYWLFQDGYLYSLTSTSKKEVETIYDNLEDAKSSSVSLGSELGNRLTVENTTQFEYEIDILTDLYHSTVIELYHKEKKKWQRVKMNDRTMRISSNDTNSKKFTFDFDLGKIYN